MTRRTQTNTLPFPGVAPVTYRAVDVATTTAHSPASHVPEILEGPLPVGRPAGVATSAPREREPRHRSRGNRLPNPRRHGAPRRAAAGATPDPEGAAPLDAPFDAFRGGSRVAERDPMERGLPVGTRVRFERRPTSAATPAQVERAEFAQVAASYVFAAALLALTFLV